MPYAMKVTNDDGTTRYGFPWPRDGGEVVEESNIDPGNHTGHQTQRGDGLALGKTFYGLGLGGFPAREILTVRYRKADVLGEDEHKVRIRRGVVVARTPLHDYLKRHPKVRANLRGAYLRGAYLRGANLRWANLDRADLRGANLRGANLRDADLRGANLDRAYLRGADLRRADLRWAYLTGANLAGADLRWANLDGANLRRADLRRADLTGALR